MSCDKLVFDLSQEVEGSPSVFVKKDWLNILDNQNGNYNSNQSVIDTSQLSNSNKWLSYREGYLAVPMLLTIASTTAGATFAPGTAGTSADYAVGLKNWFGQMVHSLTLDYNGTTTIQQTPYCNMWNSFKLMTSLSWNDVWTQGATIGFYPDDPLAFTFNRSGTASLSGMGVCNNSTNVAITPTSGAFNNYRSGDGNEGFVRRQQYINFDADGVVSGGASASLTFGAGLLSSTSASQIWKSYISTKITGTASVIGVFQISIMATIYLKHLHSFFASVPLLKGAYMKATLNLNNTTSNVSVDASGNMYLTSVSNAVGGVNPVMIADRNTSNGGVALGLSLDYTANLSVGAVCLNPALASTAGVSQGGVARQIYLYLPSYSFNPVFESAYLSAPVKQIKYTDIYQYQIRGIGAQTGIINQLITNGIANIKSILVIPFFSDGAITAGLGSKAWTGLPVGIPAYQSPFDPAGCGATSPMVQLTNFNVVVSGQNAIYNTQRYSFEEFNNQLYGVNAVNGGMTDGLTSGLIDRLGFDMEYGYYYVDLSRMLPVEESVPKSVQLVGQNLSMNNIDLFCFIEYGVSVSIDALTGVRV
jgi:hypothetical protein